MGSLASRAPVVLFLDDLEWADTATLEVLDYASKRWAEQGAPVLLLIAARPGEPGGQLHLREVALVFGTQVAFKKPNTRSFGE